MNIDLIQWRATQTPHRPALWFNGRWLTYAELNARAVQLANRLRELGVKRGDRVGILALNHPAHIDLMLAAPKLGFIFTPFNYRLSPDEIRQLSAYVRPSFMFADSRHLSLAQTLDCPWARLADYKEWLEVGDEKPSRAIALSPDDTHMILFTGGSTGLPKGALIPYRQVLANCANTVQGWGLTENDCAIQATPCFHAALHVLTTPLLYLGGRVVLVPQFQTEEYLKLVSGHGVTLMFMVPTMYQMLSEDEEFDEADLSRVRWAISGGAPCPPTVRAAYARRSVRFKQGFGMTEAGVNCFMIELDEAAERPDSVGRPLPNTQAVIRRADGTTCEVNEVGELTLAGSQVCTGYFERDAEWAKVYRDGWLWTGDLARKDSRGLYTIVGRSKEMYISGGENVYPAEVEAALCQCEGVAECAVLGVPDPKWGEIGLAVVVARAGKKLDSESLKAQLKTRLAGYKVPHTFMIVPELPKTGAGKVAKPELRRQYEQRAQTSSPA